MQVKKDTGHRGWQVIEDAQDVETKKVIESLQAIELMQDIKDT